MKRLFFFCIMLPVIFISCGPSKQTLVQEMNIRIRIEYREESYTRQMILQLLRTVNTKDLVRTGDGSECSIEAVFAEVTPESMGKIERIEQEIRKIPGVFYVELMRPIRPVMETIRNPATYW